VRKLAVFSAGYAAAVFVATSFLPERASLPLGGFCVLLWLLLCLLKRVLPQRRRRYALLSCAGMAVGLLWTWGYGQLLLEPARQLDDKTVELVCEVRDFPQKSDYGATVLVRAQVESGKEVSALLHVDGKYMNLMPGDRISTIAHCTLATHTQDGEEITYYTAKGIFLTAVAYGELTVQQAQWLAPACVPAYLSRELKQSMEFNFSQDAVPLVKAVVTGNRDHLSDGFTSSLQRTGLAHTVAVSGMHLAYLAGFLALLFGRGSRRSALITLPAIALFALVAGGTPSVVRAAIMIAMLQLAPLLERERDDMTALAFALLLLLLHNPYAAANVGLQMSFGAVAGILLFSNGLQLRMLEHIRTVKKPGKHPGKRLWNVLVRFVVSTLAATTGALVFTTPLTAVYFGRVSLIAPLANLLTLWAVSGVFVGGILAGILGVFWPVEILTMPVEALAHYLEQIIELLGRLDFAAIPVNGPYYILWLLFLYAVLAAALLMRGRKRLKLPAVAALTLLLAAILLTNRDFRVGELKVQVLDVGQGQSVLIRSGDRLALVDCGGDGYENAGDIAADHIQSMGYSTIDLLVVSHYHADHANGIPELLDRVDIKEIILPDVEEDALLRRKILEQAQRRNIPVHFVREDLALSFGEESDFTVYPPMGGTQTNELGLTVLCSAGDYEVLITGDMGTSAEKKLLEYTLLPDVELMVAGHHGSKYSNSQILLETVRPDVAVFSVGADNSYGHPTEEAIGRFEAVGAEIYRTDLNGTVTITVDPDRLQE